MKWVSKTRWRLTASSPGRVRMAEPQKCWQRWSWRMPHLGRSPTVCLVNTICYETSDRGEWTKALRCITWAIGGWWCHGPRKGMGEDDQFWERKNKCGGVGCTVCYALGGGGCCRIQEAKRRVWIPGNMQSESSVIQKTQSLEYRIVCIFIIVLTCSWCLCLNASSAFYDDCILNPRISSESFVQVMSILKQDNAEILWVD